MAAINPYQSYPPGQGYPAPVPMGISPRPDYSQYGYYPPQQQVQTGAQTPNNPFMQGQEDAICELASRIGGE